MKVIYINITPVYIYISRGFSARRYDNPTYASILRLAKLGYISGQYRILEV